MTKIITIVLFFTFCYSQGQEYISPRKRDKDLNIIYSQDSLSLWNYDLIEFKNALGAYPGVVFFRNKPIKRNKTKDGYIEFFFPEMHFIIRQIEDLDDIKRALLDSSSCYAPDNGGGYIVLENYVLNNAMSCVSCSLYFSKDSPVDFCRKNIIEILKGVYPKSYNSFEELCGDLPVDRKNYENFRKENPKFKIAEN